MALTVQAVAAANRLSATLARHVTTAEIENIASWFELKRSLVGSNKAAKLAWLVSTLISQRKRVQAQEAIATLTMAAHGRTTRGLADMTEEDVDAIVSDMRRLDIDPAQLANKGWRGGLRKAPPPTTAPPTTVPPATAPPSTGLGGSVTNTRATLHKEARNHILQLVGGSIDPKARGRQLEHILHAVLFAEKLSPDINIVIPGEQIDLAFTLDGSHYLVECKWEADRTGLPDLHLFTRKVETKAEGTFGVLLSMNGFVADMNDKAQRGDRLKCIGLVGAQFMDVLEGRATWAQLVRDGRRAASTRSLFCSK
jgi:hypothetical protein